jgi:outer membrane receptor for ferrienterochelin and colicin
MKRYLIVFMFFLFVLESFSQIKGTILDENKKPVVGANVYWLGTQIGTISSGSGNFELSTPSLPNTFVVSYTGYKSDTVLVLSEQKNYIVSLQGMIELDEINVSGRASSLIHSRITPLHTQKITGDELAKAACCNLGESFTTNPSVDVTYSDAATGSKQIKLLGLSGNYVQMLTENAPNLRGLASTYGLNYIPGPWMESILLSKGASSVINGYEALTGQINVEFKKPQDSEKLYLNLFSSDAGRMEANMNAAIKINKNLSTGILAHVENDTFEHDDNNDGFLDQPKVQQYHLFNRWYYQKGNYRGQLGLKFLQEERLGGQSIKHTPSPYKIGVNTHRYEFFLKNGYILDASKDRSIGLIISGSQHEQNTYYSNKTYDAEQANLYANFLFQTKFKNHHQMVAGTSFNFDKFDEILLDYHSVRDEFVPGVFGEYTFNLHHKLLIVGGLRGDYHSKYGFFTTPRLHVKYNPISMLHFRASAGKGYRTPNVLAENNYLLASNRLIQHIESLDNLKQEEAWNYGFSTSAYIPLAGKELNVNLEWYFTDFQEQTVIDIDKNTHEINFYNLNGTSYSNSLQIEASYELLERWTMTLAHRITDVKTTINGELREKPLTSRYKSLFTTSYQTPLKKWQVDFTAHLNGGGRMPDANPDNPLWEKEFKPYAILQGQITKNFKTWSVYLGSENLTDFKQPNPIISAADLNSENFDASMIWGPLHGRKIYIGLRWSIE